MYKEFKCSYFKMGTIPQLGTMSYLVSATFSGTQSSHLHSP